MSEISGPRPLPPSPAPHNMPAQNNLAVRLLSPLEGILAAGESARAEVIAVREHAQHVNLQLQLTLQNGQTTTVQAQSAKPLDLRANLNATALSDTRLSLAPLRASNLALNSLDLKQLPVDTLVQGKVISSEALTAGSAAYRLSVQLLNTPLAGKNLLLDSNLALSVGSLLTAKVQDRHNLSFVPLGSRLEQLALGQQLAAQHGKQGSLDGLFKALQGLSAQSNGALRGSIDQLLGALPDASKLSTAKGLADAVQHSGLLLESKLLHGQPFAAQNDFKANLLRLIAIIAPQLPGTSGSLSAMTNTLAHQLPAFARQLLGAQHPSNTARQHPLNFPLSARQQHDGESKVDLEMLLKMAAAAISRLQTHQLSSLAQSQSEANGLLLTTWQLELPMRQQADIVSLQLKFQREQASDKNAQPPRESLWRVELAFDLEHLGPLQVSAQLQSGHISTTFWAQRSETHALITTELGHLRERLQATGLSVDQLACHQGMPEQTPRTTLEQRWVDDFA